MIDCQLCLVNYLTHFLLTVCFKVFDTDHDGLLSKAELEQMVEAMLVARKENKSPDEMETDGLTGLTAAGLATEILSKHDVDKDG